ncbi:MAG TPA: fibronectin type III domain-containing protein [Candidatus Limnocylindria bacterium]|nr:fibronectin type III domain-containing protein [Candidatus Limnocylindria bacterium]
MTNRHSPPALPQAPVDLMAVTVNGCNVLLAWTECGAGGVGFRIERADGIGSACLFSEIGRTRAQVAVFSDDSVKSFSTYTYRVHAWNASGDSSPSNVVEVTTPQAGTELSADPE